MSKLVSRVLLLTLFLTPFQAHPAAADSVLKVPFEYAKGRNSILLPVRINDKPALLILDTGAAHTVLCPEVAGIDRKEPAPAQTASGGGRDVDDAVGREVELQVGSLKWEKRKVAVMDLSQIFSVYQEKIDGILGMDFLNEFSLVTINTKDQTLTLTRTRTRTRQDATAERPSSGNLRKLTFGGGSGQYLLNGVKLPRISADAICLNTADLSHTICITFFETVLISKGKPIDTRKKDLVSKWSEDIPLVAKILKQQDAIASLKPLAYTLIAPRDGKGLHLREQLTLLWSADPADAKKIGHTGFGPAMELSEPIVDVQYRALITPADHLIGKIMLQILYVQDGGEWMTLGAFVIVSKPNGDYEFYLVPRGVLDQIVIEKGESAKQ
jgi:hypothetical protein